jgi:hypothetical protein
VLEEAKAEGEENPGTGESGPASAGIGPEEVAGNVEAKGHMTSYIGYHAIQTSNRHHANIRPHSWVITKATQA